MRTTIAEKSFPVAEAPFNLELTSIFPFLKQTNTQTHKNKRNSRKISSSFTSKNIFNNTLINDVPHSAKQQCTLNKISFSYYVYFSETY